MPSINTNTNLDPLHSLTKLREVQDTGKKQSGTKSAAGKPEDTERAAAVPQASPRQETPETDDFAGGPPAQVAEKLSQAQTRAASSAAAAPVRSSEEADRLARWAAQEMARQPSIAMAAQANQSPPAVLALLRV